MRELQSDLLWLWWKTPITTDEILILSSTSKSFRSTNIWY